MGSDAMKCIPSFINYSGIQKLMGGDTQTHREHGDLLKAYFNFCKKGKWAEKVDLSLPLIN
jgi:hypothetical protein